MIATEIADVLNQSLSALDKVLKAKQLLTPGSLVEVSSASRVVAPCIYERGLLYRNESVLNDVIRTAENLYTGFYLLALNSIMPIGNIDVEKTLGRLNPNRTVKNQVPGKLKLESADGNSLVFLDEQGIGKLGLGGAESIQVLNDTANLVTGKYLMVTLTDGSATLKLPINIKMRFATAQADVLEALLSVGGAQNDMKTRWHRMMAGELSFWGDLIWSSDLIREHKKLMRMDDEGVFKAVQAARLRAVKASAMTGVASSGAIASTYIISSETLADMERKTGRSMRSFSVRQKLMEESLAMQMAIIDEREGVVTFYFHSISEPTIASFKQLEKGGKKQDGTDLLAIMQALKTGNVPSIR